MAVATDRRGTGTGVIVEVGVGGPDREAFRIIHGDLPTVIALADVVSTVAGHRTAGAPPHPLNRLAQERLLRWRLRGGTRRSSACDTSNPPSRRCRVRD